MKIRITAKAKLAAAAFSVILTILAGNVAWCASNNGPITINQWFRVDQGKTGDGSMPVHADHIKQMLLVARAKDGAIVQAFDPVAKSWSDYSTAFPIKKGINPYYQTAYDPCTKTVFCLSGGSVLYGFNNVDKTWKALPPAPELDGLSQLRDMARQGRSVATMLKELKARFSQ
jgi:hypothetical protein